MAKAAGKCFKLDLKGLMCPLPLLRAKKKLSELHSGDSLKVVTTDPGSVKDFRSYCQLSGHQLLDVSELELEYHFTLIKK